MKAVPCGQPVPGHSELRYRTREQAAMRLQHTIRVFIGHDTAWSGMLVLVCASYRGSGAQWLARFSQPQRSHRLDDADVVGRSVGHESQMLPCVAPRTETLWLCGQ